MNIRDLMKGKYIREHCVPTKVLLPLVTDALKNDDQLWLEQLIDRYCCVAYITKDEDKTLRKMCLSDKMPGDWSADQEGEVFARYIKVGIPMMDSPPEEFEPDKKGRSEMYYSKPEWNSANIASELRELWAANLKSKENLIRAILVGFPHSRSRMSCKCGRLWKKKIQELDRKK